MVKTYMYFTMNMALDLEKDLKLVLEMVIRGVIACELLRSGERGLSDLHQKLKQGM